MPDESQVPGTYQGQNIFEGNLFFNGISGETGQYALDPMPTDKLVRLIVGKPAPGDLPERDLRFLEGLSEERQKLVDSLTGEQRQLLETLANKPQQLDQLIEEQQRFFEALSDDQQIFFQRLLDEQQSLFQRVVDEQKQKLYESLTGKQPKLLGELLDERWKSYEEQKRVGELQFKRNLPPGFPVKEGVDPKDLKQSGWAAIFPAEMDARRKANIQKALHKLLKRRQEQAGPLFKIYQGAQGYRRGETKDKFLQRHKVGAGAADPEQMPFYVLLIGSPEEIPYEFQYQLDVMRGVGRLDFGDDYDAYARYAESVIMAEEGQVKLPRRAAFFGVKTPGDKATQLSADYLVEPLYKNLQVREPDNDIRLEAEWHLDKFIGEHQATKAQLKNLLGGDPNQTPALLLTASHGMEFAPGNPKQQIECQGALLCQDWPGPSGSLSPDHYFSAKDLPDDANVAGLIAMFFACYGAGTPKLDQFAAQAFKKRKEIAPSGFIAALPKRLLSHGALAVIGHVERAWGYSFVMPSGDPDHQAFVTALRKLMNGEPVGLATDPSFNLRYADMSSALSVDMEERKYDPPYSTSDAELAQKWTANNDARGYVVLGDPAVRIPFAATGETPTERPVVTASFDDKVSLDDLGLSSAAAQAIAPLPESKAPPPMVAKPGDYATSFGIGEQWSNLTGSVGQFTSQLAKALSDAAAEIATLKIRTYTTNDIQAVSQGDKEELNRARLRAMTTVAFDGDLQVYVPETTAGDVDRTLWQLHELMVHEAQANRAQFLQAIGEMATNLLKIL